MAMRPQEKSPATQVRPFAPITCSAVFVSRFLRLVLPRHSRLVQIRRNLFGVAGALRGPLKGFRDPPL
jgi:hypothetical protein